MACSLRNGLGHLRNVHRVRDSAYDVRLRLLRISQREGSASLTIVLLC